MEKRFGVLLCTAVLIGAMSANLTYAVDLTIPYETTDSSTGDPITHSSYTVNSNEQYGNVTVGTSAKEGSLEVNNTLTIDTKLTNNAKGTVTNNSNISAGALENSGTITNNDTKVINVTGTLTNNNKIDNNGNLSVGSLTNNSTKDISGHGNLTVKGGSNSGNITQAKLTNQGTFTNNGIVSAAVDNELAKSFTNTKTVNGNVTNAGTFNNNVSASIGNSTNKYNITNNAGTLTNNGNIYAAEIENKSGAKIINNSSVLYVDSLANGGTIEGANGVVNIGGGSNTSSITQSVVNVTGDFLNDTGAEIIAGTINNNSGTLTNKGTLGNNTTALNNSSTVVNDGIINANTVTNKKDANFTNNGTVNASVVNNEGTYTNTDTINTALIENSNKFDNQSIIGTADKPTEISNSGEFSNSGTIISSTIANTGNGKFTNTSSVTANAITNAANATINNNSGTMSTVNLTNNGSVVNNAVLEVTTLNNAIANASITGDNGTIKIGGGQNLGSIVQKDVTITGDLLNNGSIESKGTFTNSAVITGNNGNLTIANGSSNGSITQNNITVNGTFANNANLEAKGTLTNSGTITNASGKEIIANAIDNAVGAKIEGAGNITIKGGTNAGDISQTDVTIENSFKNTGIITSSGEFTNTATITNEEGKGTLNINTGSNTGHITQGNIKLAGEFSNSGALIAAINNNTGGVIGGEGSIKFLDGSVNDGSISQKSIDVTGTLTNNKTIVSTNSFNNNGKIEGTNGTLSIKNGTNTGSITQNSVTVNGTLTNNKGSLNVNTIENKGTINLNNGSNMTVAGGTLAGTINANGTGNVLAAGTANVTGSLNVNKASDLSFNSGNIVESAVVNVVSGGALSIDGGNVALNNNDKWNGTVNLKSGSLTANNLTNNGNLVATGGKLDLEAGNLNISKGSSIADAVVTNIADKTTLNVNNGGKVSLNSGDKWEGKIVLGSGTTPEVTNLDDTEQLKNATILNVAGLDKTGTILANNGVLLLGDKDLDVQGESYIAKAVAMELGGNIKVSNGGKVAIDDNDKMTGSSPTVTLSEGGTLDYGKTVDSNLVIKADAGNLNLLGGSNLTFKQGNIADKVALDIQKDANLKLVGSTLNLDSEDKWNGNIINEGGTINANHLTKSSDTATLTQSTGDLNVYNDSNLVLGTESSITGGNITITKGAEGQNGSVLTVYGDTDKNVIDGGNMTIDEYSKFVLGSGKFKIDTLSATAIQNEDGTIQAALVDVMNGEISESTIGQVILASGDDKINQANFNIDVYARSNNKKDNDTFRLNSIDPDATVYVNQWGLGGDLYGWDAPIDRHIQLKDIFLDKDGNALLNNIVVTKDTTFTPIGWYQLNKNEEYETVIDPTTGMAMKNHIGSNYTLDLVKYNPEVFRGQVATVAQWMNQLSIDDMLFTHSFVLPSFKDEKETMANRYAATEPLFAPYQYSRKDGGLWYKMYGTFEHLQMNNNLRVGNNSYGALIGADFGLKELNNGWKFMPTAYIGYNGAHQYWSGMGQYQNGGQAGFLGTWYKDNLILGALAYGGIYDNSMDVRGFSDETFNYFAGAAGKAAYNWRFHKDWVLQPNLMAAYNFFGQQNWHSDFGQMGMMAGMLHGVNIAPGVNLIWEKETFSTYLTLQYMYNINGACGGRAGHVNLPHVEMERGYIQYGIGFTKTLTDRFSGYFQAVLRNVGRTGVGFQAGFNYKLGK